jgi:hypothetical protein
MIGTDAGYLLLATSYWSMLIRIVLAVFGVLELFFPRQLIDYMMDVTTTRETTYEFKPWVYKVARLEGLAFVLIAVRLGKNRDEDS